MAKIVASKCTLAARVDCSHECPSGSFGEGKNKLHLTWFL